MGIPILSISRNLLSKFKPKSFSDVCFIRRKFSPAAGTIFNPHAPTLFGDMNPNCSSKSMFLIDHVHKGITNYSLLSVSEIDHHHHHQHHRICSPFYHKYDLVGSCKEWILFCPSERDDEDENSFHPSQSRLLSLWNPTTNSIKTLPPSLLPSCRLVSSMDINCFGFGFDPKSQDYKLICFVHYTYTSYSFGEVHIQLYSLKNDSWKRITPSHHVVGHLVPNHPVHINGIYYWASDMGILSFDFADEKFSRISLPVAPPSNYCLAEFHGLLAVIVLTDEEKQPLIRIEIWVWDGETWNVGPRVEVGDFPVGDSFGRVLGLFENEYLFLQGCNKEADELMLFNCKTGKLEKLGIQHDDPLESEVPRSVRRPGIFPYTIPI